MSDGLNKVQLIGNLGADPELKYVGKNDEPVLRMRVATTESWKDKESGERQEVTEWHTCSFWGPRGEGLSKILNKGDRIYVEGKLQTRKVEGKNEGDPDRYFTEVKVMNVILCGGGGRREDNNGKDERRARGRRDDRDEDFPTGSDEPARNDDRGERRGDGRRGGSNRRSGWD